MDVPVSGNWWMQPSKTECQALLLLIMAICLVSWEFVEYVNRINRVREEKAAMLLYLVTKNHSFSDGNKRIAATLFLWFLNNNHILYREDGSKRLADNTLVALTLMIAESKTEEKDVMVKVVVNLINQRNE